ELSQKTNAPIVYGPNANPAFESIIATDEQVFKLGKIKIKVLHTPGHTMESSCYLLFDENGKEYCIFTGDTLFIGDVGRPDLAQKSDLTVHDLAGHLYDSLRNKILPLSDHLIVYPAHGAGSACGKNMSKETFDSLGHQKQVNYALQEQSKEDFIKAVTDGLTPPPYYFPKNVQLNKTGSASLETVMESGLQALSPEAFEVAANETGAIILDTRQAAEFKDAFIPNSINIGIKGDFAPWVGTLITDIQQPIIFVAEAGLEKEVITRLSRVGYDNILGYLEGGIEAWKEAGKETDSIESISPQEFRNIYLEGDITVKDVRKSSEYETEHLVNADNIPLAYISENMGEFSKKAINFIHCAGGYRSMIAASILKSRGFDNVVNVEGGIGAIKQLLPTSDLVSSH
ncbi:MAG TPA: MBL fold metallo-hydrolase, partial [Emticicia sp.]